MEKITNASELRAAIIALEFRQKAEGTALKAQLRETYETLRPVNLIRNGIKDLVTSPETKEDLLNTSLSLVIGFISKKLIVGSSHNPLKQLAGTLLQMGVSSLVSKNADGIKAAIIQIIDKFTKKDTSED